MSWAHPRSPLGRATLWAVLLALASLTLLAERPFDEWRRDLEKEDVGRRRLAAQALREVPDERVSSAVQALSRSLRDPDPSLAKEAKETLRLLAPRAGPLLARAAALPEGLHVEEAMELLGHGGAGVVPAVVEFLLSSSDPLARERGIAVLERLGPAAADAKADLERLSERAEGELRMALLRLLWIIDRDSVEFFRAAQQATQDPDPEVRSMAWLGVAHSPWILVRARDPRYAAALAETVERELPFIPPPLRRALDEGLAAASR